MKKLPSHLSAAFLGVLTFALVCNNVFASPIYFSDRSSFNAAVIGTLDFQSFETTFPSAATVSFGDFSFSETGASNPSYNMVYWTTSATYPWFVTDGNAAIYISDNTSSVGTFQFSNPINAFGVDVTLYTSISSSIISIGGDLSRTINVAANTPAFFGAIDYLGTFDTITFDASGSPIVGWDSVSYGTTNPIPEPATILLITAGLVGLAGFRRKLWK